MAKQTINIGTVANDGTGDPARTAFTKANENFDDLYGVVDPDGSSINIDTITDEAGTGAPDFTYGLSVPDGQGIDFSASAGGGATSSIFDDYEEGTFSPAYTSGTGGFNGSAITVTKSNYTKIGKTVDLEISLKVTGGGVLSVGDYLILSPSSFPFTPNSTGIGGKGNTQSAITTGAVACHSVGISGANDIVVLCIYNNGSTSAATYNTTIKIRYMV